MHIVVILFAAYIHLFYRENDYEIQYLKLFLASTTVNQNMSIVNLSMNSELILEEPLSVAFVITFGIKGDCILEELIVNASIDDIYGNHIMHAYCIASD